MGKACSTHGGDAKCIQNFSWKSVGKRPLERASQDVLPCMELSYLDKITEFQFHNWKDL
jgi:hypothetical protein